LCGAQKVSAQDAGHLEMTIDKRHANDFQNETRVSHAPRADLAKCIGPYRVHQDC
jgi:hypothetical protein